MAKKSTASLPLDQQILQLSRAAEELGKLAAQQGEEASKATVKGLSRLAEGLKGLVDLVSKREEERTNLLALADIGQVVNSSLKLDEVLRIVMDTIVRLTEAERGFLMLKDEEGELSIQVARNWEQESLQPSEFAISSTVVKRVAASGQAVLTTNAQEDPRFGEQESVLAYSLRSILCVPLKVKEELIGVLYADNRVHTALFTEADRDLLDAFANQAAVAIENARLFESVRRTLAEVTDLKTLMDNVFASVASGVLTTDVEEKITLCNQAAERILGHSAQALVGKQLQQALPEITQSLSASLQSVREKDGTVIGLEISPTLPKRGVVDLRFNLSPLRDAQQQAQGIAIVVDDLTEQKRLEAQRRLFERLVSPAVIEQLDPDKLSLGGQQRPITVLFADIRGFTGYSEPLSPEELVAVLNLYLAASAEAVLAQEGTIDKFMGDGIMAWFNAPIPQPDHTMRAVRAALDIRKAFEKLHRQLPAEARLSFGAGIHFGEAVLGLVGTEKRLDYTAIGDSVNTAKRIQEGAAPGQILISEPAYRQVHKAVEAQPLEPLALRGKRQPVKVYEISEIKG